MLPISESKEVLVFNLFRHSALLAYSLSQRDIIALRWFLIFAASGKMHRIPIQGGAHSAFFRVDYEVAAKHLFAPSARSVRDSFARLSGVGLGAEHPAIYPLSRMVLSLGRGGSQAYYAANRACMEDILVGKGQMSIERILYPQPLISPIPAKSAGPLISAEIETGIRRLLETTIRVDGVPERLFKNLLPEDRRGEWTKGLRRAALVIRWLYEGRFLSECPVDARFLSTNEQLWPEPPGSVLRRVRGDWGLVWALLSDAVERYCQWFDAAYLPESKTWLPRDLAAWLYDPRKQTSIFLACSQRSPYPLRERWTDRVWDQVPLAIRDIAQRELYLADWDELRFWCRIRDTVRWFETFSKQIMMADAAGRYWFDGGLVPWFARYVAWLSGLGGRGVHLSQIGPGNPTWAAWCVHGQGLHGFALDLTKYRLEDQKKGS
jgi:hypothetical protein